MISTLYHYLLVAIFVTTSVFGLLFLTQFNETRKALHNFRIAKRLTAVAFFFVAIGNLLELFEHTGNPVDTSSEGFIITQILTLSVSVTQAFILTLVCVMLLNPKSIKSKQLIYQTAAIVAYIIVVVVSYLLFPKSAHLILVYFLNTIYCIILVYFTVFFIRRYREFRQVMDNFYSDDIASRMHWIAIAFYGALGIGIFSLVTTQYSNLGLNFAFGLSLLCFYVFLGVKLLNYPWQFEIIETPMTEDIIEEKSLSLSVTVTSSKDISYEDIPCISDNVCIGKWVEEKHFLKSGITIEDLAEFLGTNRTYLSSYFNIEKGITFRQWINSLRIEEAKLILTNNPKITITELINHLGYADTSTFFRQFKTIEGIQPSAWKQKNLSTLLEN